MSADNWALCPRCKERDIERLRTAVEMVKKSYGKVPEEEYMQMKEDLAKADPGNATDPTLREDYEIGIGKDGMFSITFRASCKCGFRFTFSFKEKVLT